MTADRSDAIVVTHTPRGPDDNPRRVVFEPRASGNWNRITYEKRGGDWHKTGQEHVASVSVETPV